MKITHQIRTGDFEYIMEELEVETHEQAVEAHVALKHALRTHEATSDGDLSPKEWNKALEGYLTIGSMPSDIGERMNKAQAWMIHELDKASARISPSEKRENYSDHIDSLKRT